MRRAILLLASLMLGPLLLPPPASAGERPAPDPGYSGRRDFGRIAFDRYSLIIDGKRTIIWSGEFHPFRLPSPDLWRDILQKMKASGFNTVSIYFDWGYHSPKPGVYDFTGIRDMDRVLAMAAEEGLYVIARPGPYVNAELTRGGYPGWLVNQAGRARTDDPGYLAAADEWMTRIDRIVARHQLTDGKGSVILFQIENELPLTTPAHARHMDHLAARARADGITVPIFHNDQGRNGYWVPRGGGAPDTVEADVDLYAFDSYPGGACTVDGQLTRASAAPDYGWYGADGAKGGSSASPHTPGFLAEYGGGWFDYWGSNGAYECNARQRGPSYERVFYGTNLANGITLENFYMAYGGTSWGWLPAPVVFTSYDYGAAISEIRALRPKAATLKQLGQFIAAVPDLARMERAEGVTASSPDIQIYHNRNPDTDARFLMVTHKPSNRQSRDRFTVDAALPDGRYRFAMQLDGFDAKWLVAGVDLALQRLVYSTSELQTVLRQGAGDVALFYGRTGEPGETLLRYASAPRVTVLEGTVRSAFDAARGDLRLDYVHGALARVRMEGGGRAPLLLLIGDEAEGARFWRRGDILLRGTALLRSAATRGATLALTGDTDDDGRFELWAAASRISWNGRTIATVRTPSGSLVARTPLAGPEQFALPDLAVAEWRVSVASPEAAIGYDDHGWADAVTPGGNVATIRPPDGQPNLAIDPHGFHSGDVWYRGRFTGSAETRRITIHYGAGAAGLMQLWLDGVPVGQDVVPGGLADPQTVGVARLALPPAAQAPHEHVLAMMIRNNGHNEDVHATGTHKEPRGLISASLDGGGRSFAVPIAWKLQGNQGGEDIADPARGVANNGGLHGERFGWHLPGFDDRGWRVAHVPDAAVAFGTRWYRTGFDLAVPAGQDATIGIAFGDPAVPRTLAAYRVLIFVNGWNMGQFVSDIGPQRVFPVPEGILDHRGHNVIALAVTSDGAAGNGIDVVRLVTLRNVRGGVPVHSVPAPQALAAK
ncbi:MAG TPA: beta-galactosidase [Sphingomonas sp.]|nr:beta-galactosidase [Sphingomonas sp.]